MNISRAEWKAFHTSSGARVKARLAAALGMLGATIITQAAEGSHANYCLAFLFQPRFRCDAQDLHDGITPNR